MRALKLFLTLFMVLGITSGIGAWTHGNSIEPSVVLFLNCFVLLFVVNVVDRSR